MQIFRVWTGEKQNAHAGRFDRNATDSPINVLHVAISASAQDVMTRTWRSYEAHEIPRTIGIFIFLFLNSQD